MAWVLGGSVEKWSGRGIPGRGDGPRTPSQMPFLPASGVSGVRPAPSLSRKWEPKPSFQDPFAEGRGYNPHFWIQGPCAEFRKVIFPNQQLVGCRDLSDLMKMGGPRDPVFWAVSYRQWEDTHTYWAAHGTLRYRVQRRKGGSSAQRLVRVHTSASGSGDLRRPVIAHPLDSLG